MDAEEARLLMRYRRGPRKYACVLELYEEYIRQAAVEGKPSVVVNALYGRDTDDAIDTLRDRGFTVKVSVGEYNNMYISWESSTNE